jgi:hypothetical protein
MFVGMNLVLHFVAAGIFLASCTKAQKVNNRSPSREEKLVTTPNNTQENPGTPQTGDKTTSDPVGGDSNQGNGSQSDSKVEITPIRRGASEVAQGKQLYESKCITCHLRLNPGEIAKFQVNCKTCNSLNSFITKVRTSMPPNAIGSCDESCARLIGFYLYP